MQYPYQINAFFEQEPAKGEPIYSGERGWLPHLNLKRRFGLVDINEEELLHKLGLLASQTSTFEIEIGEVNKPEFMPVRVLAVGRTEGLMGFHLGVFRVIGSHIRSKFPEREQDNYYPHITLDDHDMNQVLDPARFAGTTQTVGSFWLVKDPVNGDNARALQRFELQR